MIPGKKVFFRAIEESDLPALQQWLNDPDISHLVGGFSFPVSLAEQRRWYERSLQDSKNVRWMVCTNDGEAIGLTGLWEIDWRNRHALTALKLGVKTVQGKGYGTDAVMTLMSYAFAQLGLNRLWGEILPFNTGSYQTYVGKCGWKVEGVYRQHVLRDGVYYDQYRVAILAEEFRAHPRAAEYLPAEDQNRIVVAADHLGSPPV
jgi:RimJ/RimL family protein N-acetyltransferase